MVRPAVNRTSYSRPNQGSSARAYLRVTRLDEHQAEVQGPGGCARSDAGADRALKLVRRWFAGRGWTAFDFQTQAWRAYLRGRSGLINAPTGLGKTLAAWMGPIGEAWAEACDESRAGRGAANAAQPANAPQHGKARARDQCEPLRVLWLTPLRALATDTLASLQEPLERADGLPELNWSVELRTGDTPASLKAKQRDRLPTALITTPESLSLLLSYPGAEARLGTLRAVIVDEWHELLSSKRGTQTELALARLRSLCPGLRTWGMSATIGNLEEAMRALVGASCSQTGLPIDATMVRSSASKRIELNTVLPDDAERFTWAGHLGIKLSPKVLDHIERSPARSMLMFCNTRSQAEIWFKRMLDERPELLGHVAIHHGSLDRDLRGRVEQLLDEGRLKCVVCTSSLDLGIDFRPVDEVLQLGSPKGVARLLQRAGRSGHRPGAVSRITGVPTNAFELVEFAAVADLLARANAEGSTASIVESRPALDRPIDVLVQHLVTCAIGDGFDPRELLREVRSTVGFERLSDQEWGWALDFVTRGGSALSAYPRYARVIPAPEDDPRAGRLVGASEQLARLHRLTIGTITASMSMQVRYASGQLVGAIEEQFIARLPVGARFVLAGRVLELVRVRDMAAIVKRAPAKSGIVPRWDGGRMSLSTRLADGVRARLDQARRGVFDGPEMVAARPLLELQSRWSRLPAPDELLVERVWPMGGPANPTDDRWGGGVRRAADEGGGCHVFLYFFEGRLVHEGLGALLAHRLTKLRPMTITATATDQGLSLSSPSPLDLDESAWRSLLTTEGLFEDLVACMNTSVLVRRQFRDIARVAGLIVTGYPGVRTPARQLQASSEMFFEVLEQFDAENLLLDQARREVLEAQLEYRRIRLALERAARSRLLMVELDRLSPLGLPIWAETLRATQTSSEKWADRVGRMVVRLEDSAKRSDRAIRSRK